MIAKVNINGVIGADVTLLDVVTQLQSQLNGEVPPTSIEVAINSVGGYVDEGMAIAEYLNRQKVEVTTIALTECMSIATVVFASGGVRLISPNCNFMIHAPWVSDVSGNADELRELAEYMEEDEARIRKVYKDRFGISDEALRPLMKRDTFIKPDQAIALGIATGTYSEAATLQASGKKPIAFSNKLNIKIMAKAAEKTAVSEILNFFKNVLNMAEDEVKNMLVELSDGVKLFVMTEDGELEGKIAYIANEDGTPSEELAPAGQHTLIDNRTITVGEGGVIESVSEAQAAEDDKDKEIEMLKAQLDEVKAELSGLKEVKAEHAEMAAVLAKLKTDYKPQAKKAAFAKPAEKKETEDVRDIRAARERLKEARAKQQAKFERK